MNDSFPSRPKVGVNTLHTYTVVVVVVAGTARLGAVQNRGVG